MVDFIDVRLPDDIERGAEGGPKFKTTVLDQESGFEQRNQDWIQARSEFDVGYGVLVKEDATGLGFSDILAFHRARKGRLVGFRFKDWTDFEIGDWTDPTTSNQSIGIGDAVKTVFQVFKRYTSGAGLDDREITKLVTGTVVVLLDNVVQGAGFTVDMNTGKITFSAAPAGAVDVQVALEFDVPVRFKEDALRLRALLSDRASVPRIELIEVRINTT